MSDTYSLDALRREIDCDLRGLEIPEEWRRPRTASLREWETVEPQECEMMPYDARITDYRTSNHGDPSLLCRLVVGLAILLAVCLPLALLFPRLF